MNMPHALALHGLQLVPVLGWILQFSWWKERRRTALVLAAAAGYAAVIGASVAHAAAGRPPFQPTGGTGVVMVAGALVVAAAYMTAIVGIVRPRVGG